MRRRAFIAALGGAAAWPMVGRTQQSSMPVIGYLSVGSPETSIRYLAPFRQGLAETAYVEGQNVAIEYRWGRGNFDQMPTLAAELVSRQSGCNRHPHLGICSQGSDGNDTDCRHERWRPVTSGLVAGLNRPGGNLTGVGLFAYSLGAKPFELLHELIPKAKIIAVLVNPSNLDSGSKSDAKEVEAAARASNQQIVIVNASNERDFEPSFAAIVQQGAGALLVMADPYFNNRREQIVMLAARHAIPAIYEWRDFVAVGGLMSYGSSITDAFRNLGVYAGKVLRGAKPADMPIEQAVKIELVLNLKTAKTLGLTFPLTLLGRADEVIE
jgi:putative tryptophan/tyrosine transport system substrate-binding protein